jgi:serine/threonine protein kinase
MSVLAQILLHSTLDTNLFTLSRLFAELVELEPSAQIEVIEAIADRDAEHAQKLKRLLDNDRKSNTHKPMPSLPSDALASAFATHNGRDRELSAGITLLEPLGEGGMGEVWKAQRILADESANQPAVKQLVAVKLLKAFSHDQKARDRFQAEQAHLIKLTHPNIARLLDAGQTASGTPWIALELVTGQTITDWCDTQQLAIAARLTLFIQVCAAVQFAHDHLVIHRDIKPSNVLVDASGQVKLLDFGIAKSMTANALTGTQERFFSLYCVSPEQLLNQAISTATDSYGLGALLYQLLCGTTLLPDALNSPTALENFVVHTTPLKPSAQASDTAAKTRGLKKAAELQRALRGDLDKIVLHALRKQPSERYRSVSAFAQDILAALTQQPVLAVGQSASYRAAKFFRRHWLITSAASVALLALITLTAMLYLRGNDLKLARDQALLAQKKAETSESSSRTVNQFLIDLFKIGNPLSANDPQAAAKELIDRGLSEASAPNSPLQAHPDMLLSLLDAASALGNQSQTDQLSELLWRRTDLSADQRRKVVFRGFYGNQGINAERTKVWAQRVITLDQSGWKKDHVAYALIMQATVAKNEGRLEQAAKLLSREDLPIRYAVNQMIAFIDIEDFAAAERIGLATLTNPEFPTVQLDQLHQFFSITYRGKKNFPAALDHASKALAANHQIYGDQPLTALAIRESYADALKNVGQITQAIQEYESLEKIAQANSQSGDMYPRILLGKLDTILRVRALDNKETQTLIHLATQFKDPNIQIDCRLILTTSYVANGEFRRAQLTLESLRDLVPHAAKYSQREFQYLDYLLNLVSDKNYSEKLRVLHEKLIEPNSWLLNKVLSNQKNRRL